VDSSTQFTRGLLLSCQLGKNLSVGEWPEYPRDIPLDSSLLAFFYALNPFASHTYEASTLETMKQEYPISVVDAKTYSMNVHLAMNLKQRTTKTEYVSILGCIVKLGGFLCFVGFLHWWLWSGFGWGTNKA